MATRKRVPADKIFSLCQEFADKFNALSTEILKAEQDKEEFSARLVGLFGGLTLMLNKVMSFMKDNGYTEDEIEKLTTDILANFIMEPIEELAADSTYKN